MSSPSSLNGVFQTHPYSRVHLPLLSLLISWVRAKEWANSELTETIKPIDN